MTVATGSRVRAHRSASVALKEVMRPPSRDTISEWADKNRVMVSKNSPEPGPWRTSRVPYTREIMDTLGDPLVREVVWQAASQVAKTETCLNFIGARADQDPGPMLVVQPTDRFAKRWSINRLDPMIAASAALRKCFAGVVSRAAANTRLHKEFKGGHLILAGANSPAELAGEPIRDLIFDEVDRYPQSVGKEGDPVSLGEQRTRNFWNRTVFKVSSPLDAETSRIYPEFLASDQRFYFMPCPHCEEFQKLNWKVKDSAGRQIGGIHWDKDEAEGQETVHHAATACYVCAHCGGIIEEKHRSVMLERGKWVATNPAGEFPGFHISALYSPFITHVELVKIFLKKKGSPETLKTFVNLQLGEPWEDRDADFDADDLRHRIESYPAEVPFGVGILTAGIDVQEDRLELLVKGWGDREESWMIGHHRLYGDTLQDEVWQKLEHELARAYIHESGRELRIKATMIDSGYRQKKVFRFVRGKEASRGIYASKGADGRVQESLFRLKRPNRSHVKPWTINAHHFKLILFRRLKWTASHASEQVGVPGYLHFCQASKTGGDSEFYAQYGATYPKLQRVGWRMVWTFPELRTRDEAIDLEVLNLAALYSLGDVVVENLGKRADKLTPLEEEAEKEVEEKMRPATPPRRRSGGWATRWK